MKSYTVEDLISNQEMVERKRRFHELTNRNGDAYYFFRFKYLSDMFYKKSIKYFLNQSECPICLDKVFSVHSCWITMCGHLFHKKCLKDYEFKKNCNSSCPMCRGFMGPLDYLDGIKYCTYPVINYLDLLEETENIIHKFCYECDAVLGTTNDCPDCISFRSLKK